MTIEMRSIAPSEKNEFLHMATAHFSELDASFLPQDDWKQQYLKPSSGTRNTSCAGLFVMKNERASSCSAWRSTGSFPGKRARLRTLRAT